MNVVFFEDKRNQFLPLAYTKPIAKFRVGILTIEEKWKLYFKKNDISIDVSYLTEKYLANKYPLLNIIGAINPTPFLSSELVF